MAGALSDINQDVQNRKATSRRRKTTAESFVDNTLASAANLVKLLPTATVLAFQILSPAFTNEGHCFTVNKYLTGILLGVCGLSCFIACFTDSYTGDDGKIYYGIATRNGMWTFNGKLDQTVDLSSYKIKPVDFVHAVFSVLVFAAVALMDNNVVNCFYPTLDDNWKALLMGLPVGVGFLSSVVFVVFPTTRHGIGYPADN